MRRLPQLASVPNSSRKNKLIKSTVDSHSLHYLQAKVQQCPDQSILGNENLVGNMTKLMFILYLYILHRMK